LANRKKKPQRSSPEGLLLLCLLITVLLMVGSVILSRNPAGAVIFPLQASDTFPD